MHPQDFQGELEGETVHYVSEDGGRHDPALVRRVVSRDHWRVNLFVFTAHGATVFQSSVPFDTEERAGTWHFRKTA